MKLTRLSTFLPLLLLLCYAQWAHAQSWSEGLPTARVSWIEFKDGDFDTVWLVSQRYLNDGYEMTVTARDEDTLLVRWDFEPPDWMLDMKWTQYSLAQFSMGGQRFSPGYVHISRSPTDSTLVRHLIFRKQPNRDPWLHTASLTRYDPRSGEAAEKRDTTYWPNGDVQRVESTITKLVEDADGVRWLEITSENVTQGSPPLIVRSTTDTSIAQLLRQPNGEEVILEFDGGSHRKTIFLDTPANYRMSALSIGPGLDQRHTKGVQKKSTLRALQWKRGLDPQTVELLKGPRFQRGDSTLVGYISLDSLSRKSLDEASGFEVLLREDTIRHDFDEVNRLRFAASDRTSRAFSYDTTGMLVSVAEESLFGRKDLSMRIERERGGRPILLHVLEARPISKAHDTTHVFMSYDYEFPAFSLLGRTLDQMAQVNLEANSLEVVIAPQLISNMHVTLESIGAGEIIARSRQGILSSKVTIPGSYLLRFHLDGEAVCERSLHLTDWKRW